MNADLLMGCITLIVVVSVICDAWKARGKR